jgi:hypothetical protein
MPDLVLNLVEKIFEDAGYTVDTTELDSIASNLRMISNADTFWIAFYQCTNVSSSSFWIAFYQCTNVSSSLTAGVSLPLPLASAGSVTVDYIWDTTANQDFDEAFGTFMNIFNTGHFVDNTRYIIEVDIDELIILYINKK